MKLDTLILLPGQALQVKTETSGVLQVTAHFADKGASGITPGNQLTSIEGTSAVDVVPAPSAGSTRMVKTITLYNNDSGAALDCTLQLNDSGTAYVLDFQTIADNAGVSFNE